MAVASKHPLRARTTRLLVPSPAREFCENNPGLTSRRSPRRLTSRRRGRVLQDALNRWNALYGRGSLSRRAHGSSAGASAEEVEGARKKDSTRQIYPSLHRLLGRKSPGMALGRRRSCSGRARARRRRERLRWVRWEQHDLYAIDFTGEEQVWGVWLMHLVV